VQFCINRVFNCGNVTLWFEMTIDQLSMIDLLNC